MDHLDAMRAFATVADRGSFAAAARRLRLSPAAVTRAVAQLEEQLGLTLLQRTTRSVRLTERGAVYLDSCKQVLDDVERGEKLARGEDATPRGTLIVAAPLLFGRLHVLPIVEALLAAYPALSVRMMLSDRVVNLVEEGIDVTVRVGELADSALIATKVGAVQRVLVASPRYLAAQGAPQTLAALAKQDIITFEGIDATDDWQFGKTAIRVEPRLVVNSGDAAIAAAEAGFGITRAFSYQVREAVERGRLRIVLASTAPPPIPVSIVHVARRLGAPNLAAFIKAAREHFHAHPVAPLRQGTARRSKA